MTNTSFRLLRDALFLFLWGAFVLWLHFSKQLSIYLHPSLQPYTVAAGVVLIVLGVFSLRGWMMRSPDQASKHHNSCCHGDHHDHHEKHSHHEHHDDCGHEHGNMSSGELLLKSLILLIPLCVVLLGQNNHYTISMIENRGIVQDLGKLPAANKASVPSLSPVVMTTATPVTRATNAAQATNQSTSERPATHCSGSMPIQVIDLLYAVQMPTYREDFVGKQVELIGQFVPLTVGNPKGNRFQAIRLFITCCAADAKPVGVTVQYDKPLKFSEMSWIKITGVPTFPMEGGRRTAILMASKVEEWPAPSQPFVY